MWYIRLFLLLLTVGSFAWTMIQLIKPEWFFAAETSANLKRKRPTWYLAGGIIGIVAIIFLWVQALSLQLAAVWVLVAIITLGMVKPIGMVFFYDQFSEKASKLVNQMSESKKTYRSVVLARGVLTVVLLLATLYFWGL